MKHENNLGFLRLVFAVLVIVAHSPELLDGNPSRELLTLAFGNGMTFGALAVDGFFLISGYLIVRSFETSPTTAAYLLKRVLRIYPAFVVAYLFSILLIGPFVGGNLLDLLERGWVRLIVPVLLLEPPQLPGVFGGLPYPKLNGAMWTVAYEFRCYLLVIALGLLGAYRRRWVFVTITLGLVATFATRITPATPEMWKLPILFGQFPDLVRFSAIFCVGTLFYLFRHEMVFSLRHVSVAAMFLLILMFVRPLAELTFTFLGAYLIFWLGLHFRSRLLASVNNSSDISYGVYLYAFPIQNTLVFFFRDMSPWALMAATVVIVFPLAYVSWTFVERPCLNIARAKSIKRIAALRGITPRVRPA